MVYAGARGATTGEAAFAYLKDQTQRQSLSNLVLLDCKHTVPSGLDFLRQLRSTPNLAQLKVLVWTDGGEPDLKERVLHAGANGVIPKTASFMQLLEDVRFIATAVRVPSLL